MRLAGWTRPGALRVRGMTLLAAAWTLTSAPSSPLLALMWAQRQSKTLLCQQTAPRQLLILARIVVACAMQVLMAATRTARMGRLRPRACRLARSLAP